MILIESTALPHPSVIGRLSNVGAARDARTTPRLSDQVPNGMEEVDVVACHLMDALECLEALQLQSVRADQPAHHGPIFLFDLTGVVLEGMAASG